MIRDLVSPSSRDFGLASLWVSKLTVWLFDKRASTKTKGVQAEDYVGSF
jgi:ABC-type transport system involved in cytochrome c biogenesis ATPase subunit